MTNIKVSMFDRIDESFKLFKNNFLNLILPIVIYQLVTTVVIGTFSIIFLFNFVDLKSMFSGSNEDILANIFTNSTLITSISIFIFLILLYLILIIPFYIGTIKGIKQSYDKVKVTPKENVFYGFKNILNSFSVYWYIFAYVALIPCLIFITGGFSYLYGLSGGNQVFIDAGLYITIFGSILFLIFSIYRGTKTNFVFSRALDKDDYFKNEFNYGISITKGNWWRIFGNVIFVAIVTSGIGAIVGGAIEIFSIFLNIGNFSNPDYNADDLSYLVEELSSFNLFHFISSILDVTIKTILTVFVYVFIYVFYKHLEKESLDKVNDIIDISSSTKKIEL